MTYIIYKYTFPNGKVYIGQTYKDSKRLNNRSAYRNSPAIYNAMNKYKTWDTEILVECPEHLADWWETSMIKIHDSMNKEKGYNRESGGHKNKHFSEESRKKMSNNHADFKGVNHPIYGKHHSEETGKKMSDIRIGSKHPMYGKHHSEETRKKMSENNNVSRKVKCVETGEIFNNISDAAKKYNTTHISDVCRNKRKIAGGYHWEYVKEVKS